MSRFGTVLAAVSASLRDLTRRDVIWHVLWPPLVATVGWVILGATFWQQANSAVTALLPSVPWSGWQWLGGIAADVLLIVTLGALIYCTALILIGAVSLPLMMTRIAARDYPDLQRHGKNALWGGIANSLAASAIFAIGWLLTLPLLLIPGAALIMPQWRGRAGLTSAPSASMRWPSMPRPASVRSWSGPSAAALRLPALSLHWRRRFRLSIFWRRVSRRWCSCICASACCAGCAMRREWNYE